MGIVRYEGSTKKMARHAKAGAFLIAFFMVTPIVAAAIIDGRWGYLVILPFGSFPVVMAWFQARQASRMIGRGAFATTTEVGALTDGDVAWRLPWTEYGGFAPIQLTAKERALYPEKGGVEVLNLDGISVGTLPVARYQTCHQSSSSESANYPPGRSFQGLCLKRFRMIVPTRRELFHR